MSAVGVLSESFDLDFKDARALGNNKEIAKDVAAMSIYGGTLAYGVDETRELATGITPLPLTGQADRIQQIAITAIHPPINVEIRPLEDPSNAGTGVLVVIVQASPSVPHMANDRYPARAGTTTRYLSEPEVDRLYGQRGALLETSSSRLPFQDFWPGRIVQMSQDVQKEAGTLRIFASPVSPQMHPRGPRLAEPLSETVRSAQETLGGLLRPLRESSLLDQIGRWEPDGTKGWRAGSDLTRAISAADFRTFGVHGVAAYAHDGHFSFQVSTSLVLPDVGGRCAYEDLWALETMGALAAAGSFYRDIPGVTFLHVDLSLDGLKGAQTRKLFDTSRAYVRKPIEVADNYYAESRTLPVAELALDPREAARDLLDRFFASFLGDADVVAELAQ